MPAPHVVMKRSTFTQPDAHQMALSFLSGLPDCLWYFPRFAVSVSGSTLPVTDHDERGKSKSLPALHGFGNSIDVHEPVLQIIRLLAACREISATFLAGLPLRSVSAGVNGRTIRGSSRRRVVVRRRRHPRGDTTLLEMKIDQVELFF